MSWAADLPSGGNVIRGQASISQSGSHMQVNQTSRNAVLNWNNFSVGKGVSVHFDNGSGATLNRVTGSLPSSINGSLSATGSLYLVNRNGVIVGSEGVINAAGFMATTLDVRDDEFMAGGGLRFFGDSRAGIVNLGSIQANSGNVALVAHSVRNEGTIQASQGSVELLAGQEVFLASPDSPGLLVSLGDGSSTSDTGVSNTGLIEAAQARLQAADGNLYNLAINQSGVIRASGVSNKNGRIVLTADGGTVRQDGVLSAHNANGSGGEILVGGDFQGKNATVANASRTEVTANARMEVSATAAKEDGGRVIVWADKDTSFAGRIEARAGQQGGDGGFAEVSGKRTLDFRPAAPIDLSAPKGKTGTVLLDPDEMTVVDTVTGANQISASTVEAGLASADYIINTSNFDPASGSGNIDVNSDISWSTANTLTLKSGNAINIDANIAAPNGALEMYAGRYAEAPLESGLDDVTGGAWLTAGHMLQVNRLRYGANTDSLPAGYTADPEPYTDSFQADGDLRVDTLELDLSGGKTGLQTNGSANTIGAFRTVGNGSIGWVSIANHGSDLSLYLNSNDAFGMQVVTPGNLTLEAGSQLTSTWGDFVLASTGGNFINQAGGNALNFTRPGSGFLIYTGTQAGTVKGGMTGTEEFSRTFAGNPPDDYTDGVSRFLYRAAFSPSTQQLTYRADNLSRFYGNANPGLTYSVSGLQNGDLLGNVVTGAPLLYTTAMMQSGVGQYAINIEQGTLASASYGFQFVGGTLTVNAAPVTIDIASLSRFYGDFNPVFSATANGLKNGDSLADALAGWSLVSSATRSSGVGGYAITASRNAGNVNANYSVSFNPGTLTINPTPVTLTLAASSMVYGNALPNFNALATLTGTYNGDTLATAFPGASFGTAATSASSVGSYAVNAASGFNNPNYVLTLGNLGALSITKAPLVINANNASRFYGDANPIFSVASATGWKNGDTLASIPGLQLISSATAASNVGGYAIVPTGTATNYEFVAGSGTLTINKAPISIHIDSATRYYGDADPLFTATYTGLKNGETEIPSLYLFSGTDSHTKVGQHLILASGVSVLQNYLATVYAGVLTVAPRPLLVMSHDASRIYGADNPLLSVSVSGATDWDAEQAAAYWVGATSATQRSDVGDYAVTALANSYGDLFDNLANYAVSFESGTLSVQRAPLTVVADSVSLIWGDGRPQLKYSVSGYLHWDSADTIGTVLLTSVAGGTNVAPGLYPITLASSNVGKNYTAALAGSPMVQVLHRPITIVGNYSTSLGQLREIHLGQMEPTTIKYYDSNGNLLSYSITEPLAGGPQFSVLASSDGTRGDNLFSYVGLPFIQPAAGTTMDEVLSYYDVTSKPGIAQVTSISTNNELIYRDFTLETPQAIEVEAPSSGINVSIPVWPSSGAPSLSVLLDEVAPTGPALQTLYETYRNSDAFTLLSVEARQLLLDAQMNAKDNAIYEAWIDETQAWIDQVSKAKPEGWEVMVTAAQADITKWQAEIDARPGLEQLRLRALDGDETALSAITPLVSAGMMLGLKNGTLSAQAQAYLLSDINEQRLILTDKAEANFKVYQDKQEMREGSLTTIVSSTKVPDLVGAAYTDLAAERVAADMELTMGYSVAAATTIATVALGLAIALPIAGTTTSIVGAAASGSIAVFGVAGGAAGAVAAPAIAVAFVAAVGAAEGIQVVEGEKNLLRYNNFMAANQQLSSLDALDANNTDNFTQAALAIQRLMAQSLSSSTTPTEAP